jgi:DNA-directed RNA polymerase specialized sigma24 family protein
MAETPDAPRDHLADLALARAVLAGDEPAWHRFVTGQSGILLAILRRYLRDTDEIRTVYVDVLAELRQGKLAEYAGRSSLATWLACIARGAAADHLRHTLGRREDPAGLADLEPRQREVFRLYYVEGRAYEDVRLRLRQNGQLSDGQLSDGESLAEILADIESRLNQRTLRRLAWDLHAASVGAASGRLLEYLDDATRATAALAPSPDAALIAREARQQIARVLALVDRLPAEERTVLQLRFDRGWTADQIATELAIPGRRRVYTILDRALARLRRWAAETEK